MGNEISRAQYLTLGAFLINVGTQTYGMLTTPNMKDVADAVSAVTYRIRRRGSHLPPHR